MIKVFNYDNNVYKIDSQDTLQKMLEREDLIKLPLSAWNNLLHLKDSFYPSYTTLLKILSKKISFYDSSMAVNSFLFNGNSLWLDKATRVGLVNLVNSSTDTVTLVLGDQLISFPVDVAKQFLAALEVYAGNCYVNTEKHKIAIKELKTIDDIINYDYTTGYPEKLSFNL